MRGNFKHSSLAKSLIKKIKIFLVPPLSQSKQLWSEFRKPFTTLRLYLWVLLVFFPRLHCQRGLLKKLTTKKPPSRGFSQSVGRSTGQSKPIAKSTWPSGIYTYNKGRLSCIWKGLKAFLVFFSFFLRQSVVRWRPITISPSSVLCLSCVFICVQLLTLSTKAVVKAAKASS